MNGKIYLLFDEIQNVKDWEKSVNGFRVDYDSDIYITGSNANLLSSELATHLAGRYITINLYPFSFKEYLKISKNPANEKEMFKEYIKYGGLPYLSNLETKDKEAYLNDVFDSIILKDIIFRNNIRDVDLLYRILTFIMYNIGQTFSAESISKYFKSEKRVVSRDTIYNYLVYIENAFFIHKVKREDVIGKKLLKFQEKYYLTDHGFREAIVGNNERDISQILENIVFMEMKRRGYEVNIGKLDKDKEIDFICRKSNEKIYIQVTYIMHDEKTREREFKPLIQIKDNYPKYVLSLDEFNFSDNGIKHLNIIDFLKVKKLN